MIQVSTDETKAGQPEPAQIKFNVYCNGQKVSPFLSEVGVLSTAINRAINDWAFENLEGTTRFSGSDVRRYLEPRFIQTEIRGVRNGSVIFDIGVATSEFISANKAGVIQGIIATGIWTVSGHIRRHIQRAVNRLDRNAVSEDIPIVRNRKEPWFNDSVFEQNIKPGNLQEQLQAEQRAQSHSMRSPRHRILQVTITGANVIHITDIRYDPAPDLD